MINDLTHLVMQNTQEGHPLKEQEDDLLKIQKKHNLNERTLAFMRVLSGQDLSDPIYQDLKKALKELDLLPETQMERIYRSVQNRLFKIFKKKNHDYGNSYFKNVKRWKEAGLMLPISNKIDRLDTLLDKKGAKVNESILDSFNDLANYSLLALVAIELYNLFEENDTL